MSVERAKATFTSPEPRRVKTEDKTDGRILGTVGSSVVAGFGLAVAGGALAAAETLAGRIAGTLTGAAIAAGGAYLIKRSLTQPDEYTDARRYSQTVGTIPEAAAAAKAVGKDLQLRRENDAIALYDVPQGRVSDIKVTPKGAVLQANWEGKFSETARSGDLTPVKPKGTFQALRADASSEKVARDLKGTRIGTSTISSDSAGRFPGIGDHDFPETLGKHVGEAGGYEHLKDALMDAKTYEKGDTAVVRIGRSKDADRFHLFQVRSPGDRSNTKGSEISPKDSVWVVSGSSVRHPRDGGWSEVATIDGNGSIDADARTLGSEGWWHPTQDLLREG